MLPEPGATSESPPARRLFPGSPNLDGIVAEDGSSWAGFRDCLTPRYATARTEMATFLLLVVGGMLLHAAVVQRFGNGVGIAVAPFVALGVGYCFASLICFMHEAAHYNLHPDKKANDRLANLLLCPLVGEEIGHYRRVHWQHHLHLGRALDTEVSYHHAPTPRFLLEALTGLHALRVLRGKSGPSGGAAVPAWEPQAQRAAILRTVALHSAILAGLLLFGFYSTAAVWLVAAFGVYPFFGTLRQLLEHRSPDARARVDYRLVDHGAVNRMFGTDLFARTFGAAGFNRHLLHHWVPQASYTCFDEIEAFLHRTDLTSQLEAARTTYWQTFCRLAGPEPEDTSR